MLFAEKHQLISILETLRKIGEDSGDQVFVFSSENIFLKSKVDKEAEAFHTVEHKQRK